MSAKKPLLRDILKDLAKRIDTHLRRFERDPKINVLSAHGAHPYYHAHSSAYSRGVTVMYVSYQHTTKLSREEAETYLAWLDAGNIGRHYEVLGHFGGRTD